MHLVLPILIFQYFPHAVKSTLHWGMNLNCICRIYNKGDGDGRGVTFHHPPLRNAHELCLQLAEYTTRMHAVIGGGGGGGGGLRSFCHPIITVWGSTATVLFPTKTIPIYWAPPPPTEVSSATTGIIWSVHASVRQWVLYLHRKQVRHRILSQCVPFHRAFHILSVDRL